MPTVGRVILQGSFFPFVTTCTAADPPLSAFPGACANTWEAARHKASGPILKKSQDTLSLRALLALGFARNAHQGTLRVPSASSPAHPPHLSKALSLQRCGWLAPWWNPHSEVFLPTLIRGCEKNLFVEGYLFFHGGSQNHQPPLLERREEREMLVSHDLQREPLKQDTSGRL